MRKAIVILVLVAGLAACGPISAFVDGYKYAKAVEADLETATGLKPGVGFDWHNGKLTSVTVVFPSLYTDKPLPELAEIVRVAVGKGFKQKPENIVLSFLLPKSTAGTTADASQAR